LIKKYELNTLFSVPVWARGGGKQRGKCLTGMLVTRLIIVAIRLRGVADCYTKRPEKLGLPIIK
jgi:hypothetical protein